MLRIFKMIPLLLALSFLTGTATLDLSSAQAGTVSAPAKLNSATAKISAVLAKFKPSPVDPFAATLEDGPEDEDTPVASLVRGYDGDDQIETSLGVPVFFASIVSKPPRLNREKPAPSHFSCAGYPTGPPVI